MYIEVVTMNMKMYVTSKKRGTTVMGKINPMARATLSDLSSPSTHAVVLTCAFESLSKSIM